MKTHLIDNHKVSLLFFIKINKRKKFKDNFPYFKEKHCPMGFLDEGDSQEHILICKKNKH